MCIFGVNCDQVPQPLWFARIMRFTGGYFRLMLSVFCCSHALDSSERHMHVCVSQFRRARRWLDMFKPIINCCKVEIASVIVVLRATDRPGKSTWHAPAGPFHCKENSS